MEMAYHLVPWLAELPAITESVSKEVARNQNETLPNLGGESRFILVFHEGLQLHSLAC